MTSPLKKRLSLLASCRGAFLGVAVLSGLINVLYLSGSIFMMEVYDRVLPEPQHPDPGRPLRHHRGALSLPGPVRHDARPDPGAGRRRRRRGPEPAGLPGPAQGAAQGQGRRRRAAAPARSRPDPGVPRRRRALGAVRPAVDAALSVHLLRLPPLDRRRGRSAGPAFSW